MHDSFWNNKVKKFFPLSRLAEYQGLVILKLLYLVVMENFKTRLLVIARSCWQHCPIYQHHNTMLPQAITTGKNTRFRVYVT